MFRGRGCVTAHVWWSGGSVQELVLSFHHVGSRDWTQAGHLAGYQACFPTEPSHWPLPIVLETIFVFLVLQLPCVQKVKFMCKNVSSVTSGWYNRPSANDRTHSRISLWPHAWSVRSHGGSLRLLWLGQLLKKKKSHIFIRYDFRKTKIPFLLWSWALVSRKVYFPQNVL